MTKTTKYLLIAGGVVLAYYLYTKSKGTKTTTGTPNTPNPQNTGDTPKVYYCKDGFKKVVIEDKNIQNIRYANPCEGHGGIDEIKTNGSTNPSQSSTIPNAYRLKEDFSKSVMTRPNVYVDVKFKKGQIISALRNPYEAQLTAVGQGALTTTIQGGLPNFNMEGQVWVSIPERLLEKV